MSQSAKRPFKDKVFYLDLKKYRNQEELLKNLKKLGAKVESFLSRDIQYVITDKDISKPKPDTWTPITPKSLIGNSPSPLYFHDSVYPAYNSNGSPLNDSRTILSRGLALVQKAKTKESGGTDVIQICNQWNIKLVPINKVLSVIAKYKHDLARYRNEENENTRSHSMLYQGSEKLSNQFIKMEDFKRKYKPQYKNFVNWKECVDTTLGQFVETLQSEKSMSNPNLKPLGESQMFNISHQPKMSAPRQALPQPKPISRILNQSKTIPLSYINEARTNAKEKNVKTSRSTQVKKKAPKRRFCEICSCSFVSMTQHLQTAEHRNFQQDPSRYKAIADVIDSLPDIAQFMGTHFVGSKTGDTPLELSTNEPSMIKPIIGICCEENLDDGMVTEIYDVPHEVLPASFCSEKAISEFPYLDGTGNTKSYYYASEEAICNSNNLLALPNSSFQHGNNHNLKMVYDTPPFTPSTQLPPSRNMNMQSRALFQHQDLVENKMEVTEAVHRYTTDFPYGASVLNGCVLKEFPFTNFGFGWKSSCEKEQNKQTELAPVTSTCSFSINMPKDKWMQTITNHVCNEFENIEGDVLDLSVTKASTEAKPCNVECTRMKQLSS